MRSIDILKRRALLALCSIMLTACSTPYCREWEIQTNVTDHPCFNSGRLFLAPESEQCHLEVEIVRSSSGVRMYINILLLRARPCPDDPLLTKVEILFEDQEEPWVIYPNLLQGGQRLLVQQEEADCLIKTLLEGRSFTIHLGRYETTILPDSFEVAYQKLMGIPIQNIVKEEENELRFGVGNTTSTCRLLDRENF